MKLPSFLSKTVIFVFVIGGAAGLLAALAAEEMDRVTGTDEFCTSCHAMATYIAKSETYLKSAHQTTKSGVRPGCADCHIPKGLVAATYTHIVNGVSDLIGEYSHDWTDPKVWEAEKPRLAYAVRDWMRANDSITCRGCHEQASIKPERKRGQRQHKEALSTGMTCIDCHYNLVHEEVKPRDSFLNSAGTSK
ncbi:MAG: cytochrome C [Rhodospirillales bacterium CG15_BIG_FIL_POST_REV_8_21_14_020_66_15]|nr:MAG: cytochrome C [Rhodospirillales bacterium CG15_BIG_FIL_POST_REV_8_21_14_020_66_15]